MFCKSFHQGLQSNRIYSLTVRSPVVQSNSLRIILLLLTQSFMVLLIIRFSLLLLSLQFAKLLNRISQCLPSHSPSRIWTQSCEILMHSPSFFLYRETGSKNVILPNQFSIVTPSKFFISCIVRLLRIDQGGSTIKSAKSGFSYSVSVSTISFIFSH